MKLTRKRITAALLALTLMLSSGVTALAQTVETLPFEALVTTELAETIEAAEAVSGEAEAAEMLAETSAKETAPLLGTSAIGDLWEGWDSFGSDTYRPKGSGTCEDPYVITAASHLMWISVNTTRETNDAGSAWYRLGNDVSLADVPTDWHPIGWYAAKANRAISFVHPFSGHLDGQGHTIRDLDMASGGELSYCGLFGVLRDAEIRDLTVIADTICGFDEIGILAGRTEGKTTISHVTVKGYVKTADGTGIPSASARIGGMVGCAKGGSLSDATGLVMDNCTAEGVRITSSNTTDASVGGLIGSAENAWLVDSRVVTTANGVKGIGYVGGICGRQNSTRIYNSRVEGLVGGNGAMAIGGITGRFESGEIILAEMDADLGNSALATHEGIIVGDYGDAGSLSYGQEDASTAAFLFYKSGMDGYPVAGSGEDRDMRGFSKEAMIGYWTDSKLKYTVVAGTNIYPCDDSDYYYEALESGVRYLNTQKLNRIFSVEDYAKGLRFAIDHYAPGAAGSPVRGYLVSIPRIDSLNSTDIDVAHLTAQANAASAYYKVMDMTTAAAVAPGAVVTVITTAKNDPENGKYYQRVVDLTVEPEKAVRPTYTDSTSGTTEVLSMDYQTGGTYSFVMPACDTELNVSYEKVLSKIVTTPTQTKFNIVETRTGDRKNPDITWQITDENGHTLCANVARTRTEGNDLKEQLLSGSDVTPVEVAAVFNTASLDNKVGWSADDASLLDMTGTDVGYVETAARIKPNVTMANVWMLRIINAAELAQKSAGYATRIPDTVYTTKAVLTATTDPAHSIDNKPVSAHCEITLGFRIIDETTLLAESVSLDKEVLELAVTRKLMGNRRAPAESWAVSGSKSLKATIHPEEAFLKGVSWEITGEAATSVVSEASGSNRHDLLVSSVFDGENSETLPAWIRELCEADNAIRNADVKAVLSASGEKEGTITVTAEDKEKGVHKATCRFKVRFMTDDQTTLAAVPTGTVSSGGSSGGASGVATGGFVGPKTGTALPSWVIKGGTWVQDGIGNWLYTNGRTFVNEWACLSNPYADTAKGQRAYDWFRFDANGWMMTGWIDDADGNRYYLQEASDGTRGRMVTGWYVIGGKEYYFSEAEGSGTMGALLRNGTTPDGHRTDAEGAKVG